MFTAPDTCTTSSNYNPAYHPCMKSSWFETVWCFRQGENTALNTGGWQLREEQAGVSCHMASLLSTTIFLFSFEALTVDWYEYAKRLCAKRLTQDFKLHIQKEGRLQSSWWYYIRCSSCFLIGSSSIKDGFMVGEGQCVISQQMQHNG